MSVQVIGVTKRFGAVTAVDNVHLTVSRGELLAIVGPSGCGKTTLIRIIAGLERPDAGRVVLAGRDATHLPPERRNVSIVFQNFALFPHMTVEENVAYGLKWRGVARDERRRRVDEALALVGLEALRRRRPAQLSAGQQQRVALARALAPRPEILLLDEPLSALDADLRERLRLEIRRIQREMGITTLLVTHDQEEALSIADRIAVMNEGALVQVDEAWRIYDAPATRFVARFIGKGNLLEASVGPEGADLGPFGHVPADHLPAAVAARAMAASAAKAWVLIRPESVRVRVDSEVTPPAASALALDATLEDVTFAGASCTLHLRAGGRPLLATAPGHQAPHLRQRLGRPCRLWVPYDALRWVFRE